MLLKKIEVVEYKHIYVVGFTNPKTLFTNESQDAHTGQPKSHHTCITLYNLYPGVNGFLTGNPLA